MSEVAIFVPRRAGDAHRDRVWQWLRSKLELELDFPIVEGAHEVGPFNRSAALNDAARQAFDTGLEWNVAVVLDADTYVEPRQILTAVDRARLTGRLVVAFDRFVALSREGTSAILEHRARVDWIEFARYEKPNAVSSCLAVTASLWHRVRGFDERFKGWGFEDRAFFETARTFAGAEKIPGHAWHLWHPRSAEKNHESELYRRNRKLAEEYRAASGNLEAMLELVASR